MLISVLNSLFRVVNNTCVPACMLSCFIHVWLFCNPMDCSHLGSFVLGSPQARILEWVAIPFSRGSSWPRDRTGSLMSPALAGRFFTSRATWEVLVSFKNFRNLFAKIEKDLAEVAADCLKCSLPGCRFHAVLPGKMGGCVPPSSG